MADHQLQKFNRGGFFRLFAQKSLHIEHFLVLTNKFVAVAF